MNGAAVTGKRLATTLFIYHWSNLKHVFWPFKAVRGKSAHCHVEHICSFQIAIWWVRDIMSMIARAVKYTLHQFKCIATTYVCGYISKRYVSSLLQLLIHKCSGVFNMHALFNIFVLGMIAFDTGSNVKTSTKRYQ